MLDEKDAILAKITTAMHATFHGSNNVPVTRETTSNDVDGWDSLSHSMLIMNVEEAFGIELPFDRAYDLQNIGELADLVAELQHA